MSSDPGHRTPSHPAGSRLRPPLTPRLDSAEFRRWHWWKDELTEYCRAHGLALSGTKTMLIDRISAHLDSPTRDLAPVAEPTSGADPSRQKLYLAYSRQFFETNPDATLRDAWRAFKRARASGRLTTTPA